MKERVHLLFTPEHVFLGEMRMREGALAHCTLTADGDRRLGQSLQEWQAEGIRSILPKDRGFDSAFCGWALDRGIEIVSLADDTLSIWEILVCLPFEAAERFVLITAAVGLNAEEATKWRKALNEVGRLCHVPACG